MSNNEEGLDAMISAPVSKKDIVPAGTQQETRSICMRALVHHEVRTEMSAKTSSKILAEAVASPHQASANRYERRAQRPWLCTYVLSSPASLHVPHSW